MSHPMNMYVLSDSFHLKYTQCMVYVSCLHCWCVRIGHPSFIKVYVLNQAADRLICYDSLKSWYVFVIRSMRIGHSTFSIYISNKAADILICYASLKMVSAVTDSENSTAQFPLEIYIMQIIYSMFTWLVLENWSFNF